MSSRLKFLLLSLLPAKVVAVAEVRARSPLPGKRPRRALGRRQKRKPRRRNLQKRNQRRKAQRKNLPARAQKRVQRKRAGAEGARFKHRVDNEAAAEKLRPFSCLEFGVMPEQETSVADQLQNT